MAKYIGGYVTRELTGDPLKEGLSLRWHLPGHRLFMAECHIWNLFS